MLSWLATRMGLSRPAAPSNGIAGGFIAPAVPSVGAYDAIDGQGRAVAFLRCLSRYPHLAPKDASAGAFVHWLAEHGQAGDWEQSELRDEYEHICDLSQLHPMAAKYWGRALEAHGCQRWQTTVYVDGVRCRPLMVRVPWRPTAPADVATDSQGKALAANTVIPLGSKRPHSRALQAQISRSGTRIKSRRQGTGGKGAFRADIAEAVACQR